MNQKIQINDIRVGYGSSIIIDGLNLEIPAGRITMLIGANGCGKSTLLKTIGRILQPSKGTIRIHGKDLKQTPTKDLAKKMAVLPQSPSVPNGLLVRELAAYGRFPYQKPLSGLSQHDLEVITWSLQATGMEHLKDRRVDSLSGGQRQRAFIAMVLAQETEIIVLDEPTTYLDMSHQLEILTLLKKINQENQRTIIVVLHELNNAAKFADHIIGMKSGQIIFEGAPDQVITKANLRTLYHIDAELQMDPSGTYPICTDYHLIQEPPSSRSSLS